MARKQIKARVLGRASQVTLGGNFGTIELQGLRLASVSQATR